MFYFSTLCSGATTYILHISAVARRAKAIGVSAFKSTVEVVQGLHHSVHSHLLENRDHCAFIKAMRASDPDAAAYYLQRMVDAGEDPLFILRRMVIFASEDIGHADPRALVVATAAVDSFRFIGLPEGMYPLMQAATYLACAPKSDTVKRTIGAAKAAVSDHGNAPVPTRYRNAATGLQKELGYGEGYQYPHHHEGHIVTESALPDVLAGRRLFEPTTQGEEAELSERLRLWGRGPGDA